MEKIIKTVLGSIALLLLLSSCVDRATTSHYDYFNDSGYNIVFEEYLGDNLVKSYQIPNGESMRLSYARLGDVNRPSFASNIIKIIFNKERVLTYGADSGNYGIFQNDCYAEFSTNDKWTRILMWTFTPEHYEMAVPIEKEGEE